MMLFGFGFTMVSGFGFTMVSGFGFAMVLGFGFTMVLGFGFTMVLGLPWFWVLVLPACCMQAHVQCMDVSRMYVVCMRMCSVWMYSDCLSPFPDI